ncbi:hypothetical protein C6T68_18155 [Burkholderia multivorans]|nr:hypothetical protein C6T68_18155 [Burkholderia multivorans]
MLVVSNRFSPPSVSDAAGILRRQPRASRFDNGAKRRGFVAKLRVSLPPRPGLDTRDTTIRP